MKKSVLISLIALGISLIGLVIALAAWLHKKRDLVCDDFDDELLLDDEEEEYISSQYVDHIDEGEDEKEVESAPQLPNEKEVPEAAESQAE